MNNVFKNFEYILEQLDDLEDRFGIVEKKEEKKIEKIFFDNIPFLTLCIMIRPAFKFVNELPDLLNFLSKSTKFLYIAGHLLSTKTILKDTYNEVKKNFKEMEKITGITYEFTEDDTDKLNEFVDWYNKEYHPSTTLTRLFTPVIDTNKSNILNAIIAEHMKLLKKYQTTPSTPSTSIEIDIDEIIKVNYKMIEKLINIFMDYGWKTYKKQLVSVEYMRNNRSQLNREKSTFREKMFLDDIAGDSRYEMKLNKNEIFLLNQIIKELNGEPFKFIREKLIDEIDFI